LSQRAKELKTLGMTIDAIAKALGASPKTI
jgi:DNA-binding XRE family transcriptional regulator